MRLRSANNHRRLREEYGAATIRAKRRTRKSQYPTWAATPDEIRDGLLKMMKIIRTPPQ